MPTLYLDLESYCEVPITHGTHAYAEKAEVMLLAYAVDDGPVVVKDLTEASDLITYTHDREDRIALSLLLQSADKVVIHNSHFDRTVLRHALGVELPVERIHDTMVQALSHGLPGSLSQLCDIFALESDAAKDKRGKQLINLFCKPRPKNSKVRRATRDTNPEEWEQFKEYAGSDIRAMRALYKKMPRWNYPDSSEHALWCLDQRINDRGFQVDVDLARGALSAVEIEQRRLAERADALTDGGVSSATRRDVMLAHVLQEYGVEMPDMRGSTVEKMLEDPNLPEGLRQLLEVRLQATTTSTAKYGALLRSVSSDGRLRGTLQFCGAGRTGRWAGRLFQPQNLPRPMLPNTVIDAGIEALKGGYADLMVGNVMELCSAAVRGCIVAPEGRKLVVADLANIEGRMAAWLTGEEWKLDAFRAYDAGTGPDLYKVAYARAFGIAAADVTKDQRQVGKVLELACLAGDTKVLTSNGVKPILDVTTDDQVWDGVEWVNHEGLVARGVKSVVNVGGIKLTPDHLVLINKTWVPAKELVSNENTLYRALATALEKIPSSVTTKDLQEVWCHYESNALVEENPTTYSLTTYVKGLATLVGNAHLNVMVSGARNGTATAKYWLMRVLGSGSWVVSRPASIVATTQRTAVIPIMEPEGLRYIRNGLKTEKSGLDILSLLKVGMTQAWNLIGSMWIKGMNRETFGSLVTKQISKTDGKLGLCKKQYSDLKPKMPVYDLKMCGSRNRFTVLSDKGPLIVHNCGYGGGVGAFLTMSAAYNMDLDAMARAAWDSIPSDVMTRCREWITSKDNKHGTYGLAEDTAVVCDALKTLWRQAHPKLSGSWRNLSEAANRAMAAPKVPVIVPDCKARFVRSDAWLLLVLPSKRALCYPSPKVEDDGQLSYMGINQFARKWERIRTYGGKLLENLTQAASRDVMAQGMLQAEQHGYEVLLTVHDELITETPDMPAFVAEGGLAELMSTNPEWAQGLPLAAAGFETTRYRKD